LERDDKGQIIRHDGPSEIVNYLREHGGTVLVLVPNDGVTYLVDDPSLYSTPLASNAELSIVAAKLR
ncbi:MAG TPA: hypothetical protein VL501_00615, partial [Pyrinomonadaceae bacterium]|nr:hypothetical protein [Pyrinomonadaceae bacterium]